MASVNKAILIGNLGRDPELKYTPSGVAVCTFTIATTETWSKEGNKQERTDWHNIVLYRKLAEIAAEYLKKGRPVYIEGRIQTRSWERDGQKHYMTEIVADTMQMLGQKPSGEGDSGQHSAPQKGQQAPQAKRGQESAPPAYEDYPPDDMGDDKDLPF